MNLPRTRGLILSLLVALTATSASAGSCRDHFIRLDQIHEIQLRPYPLRGGDIVLDTNLLQAVVMDEILEPIWKQTSRRANYELQALGIVDLDLYFNSNWKERLEKLPLTESSRDFIGHLRQSKETPDVPFLNALHYYLTKSDPDWKSNPIAPSRVYREIFNKNYEISPDSTKLELMNPKGLIPKALAKGNPDASVFFPVVALETTRPSPEYQEALQILKRYDVGGGKGEADREIIADLYFAKKSGNQNLIFATYDLRLVRGLLRLKGIPQNKVELVLDTIKQHVFPSETIDPFVTGLVVSMIKLASPFNSPKAFTEHYLNLIVVKDIPLQLSTWREPKTIDIAFGFIGKL